MNIITSKTRSILLIRELIRRRIMLHRSHSSKIRPIKLKFHWMSSRLHSPRSILKEDKAKIKLLQVEVIKILMNCSLNNKTRLTFGKMREQLPKVLSLPPMLDSKWRILKIGRILMNYNKTRVKLLFKMSLLLSIKLIMLSRTQLWSESLLPKQQGGVEHLTKVLSRTTK